MSQNRSRLWRRIVRCAGASILVALGACRETNGVGATRATSEPLRFSMDLWSGFYPAVVAAQTGIFDSLGVTVRVAVPQNTDAMRADFAAGRSDLMASSLADAVLMVDLIPDLRVILCSDESVGADQIIGRRGITRLTDLRGKRVGVNLGSFSELLLARALASAGVKEAEIALVNTDAAQAPGLLRRGELDAAETWEPYAAEARADGGTVLFSSAQTPGLIVDCVIVRSEIAATRGADVERFVRGWFLGLERMRRDPEGSRRAVAAFLPVPVVHLEDPGVRLLDLEENRRRFTQRDAADGIRASAERYVRFFGLRGGLRREPRLDQMLDARFLPTATGRP
jgi:NitT/TauT family transport system substrate-binding protein